MSHKNPMALHGTMEGVWQHRAQGTPKCEDCLRIQAATRLLNRVLGGHQKGCYVPLAVLGELLRCATPEVLALAEELLPSGAVHAAEEFLQHHARLADEGNRLMNENENPPTLPCPYDCGGDAESQDGTSYYICPTCDAEFDRDELDEHGRLKED